MRKNLKYKDRKNWFLVAHAPLDPIVLLLAVIDIIGLIILAVMYQYDETTSLSSGSSYLLMFAVSGIFIQFLVKGVVFIRKMFGHRDFHETSPHLVGFFIDFSNEIDVFTIMGNIFGYILIQIVVKVISGAFQFQVAGVAVFLFYIFAAITEELFFRGAIIMVLQTILYKILKLPAMPIINFICAFVSASVFLMAHTHYLGDIPLMLITFMGGFLQSYIFIQQKSLLSPIISHVVINAVSSAGVIQHE